MDNLIIMVIVVVGIAVYWTYKAFTYVPGNRKYKHKGCGGIVGYVQGYHTGYCNKCKEHIGVREICKIDGSEVVLNYEDY